MPSRSLAALLTRRRGSHIDNLILRTFGAVALLGILWSLLDPMAAALAPFVLYTMWANGPHSSVLQGAYEPVLLVYGQLFSPLLLAALGTAATVFIEWANYHIYARARDTRTVGRLTAGRLVQRVTALFARRPFLALVLSALGLVPYGVTRCLSVLSRYPIARHLAATGIGRFPRLWVIAALGVSLSLPPSVLIAVVLLSFALAAALWFVGRRASLVSQSA
ncbi:MAG TPA: hypothetical protein VKD28_16325 [Gemmatimonadales bacterium]|nr:hypothetical protein [Gemmatimonadales bacterium]